MEYIINTPILCKFCKNRFKYKTGGAFFACDAFPEGIPKDVLNRDINHTKKHPDQKNDILFEPVKTK